MSKSAYKFIPFVSSGLSAAEMAARARRLRFEWAMRRSQRMFSDRAVPRSVIEDLIMAASSAPSGANKQPWTFCVVGEAKLKTQIREAAEKEEYENYHGRMPGEWLKDLQQFGTDWQKPFLEIAPWLIIIFKRVYEIDENDPAKKNNNYYVTESVGIATGMFLNAVHQAGLVSLTHTPSPMNFLGAVLGRPENERPFLLIPVGYPADDAVVPDLRRKGPDEVIAWYE